LMYSLDLGPGGCTLILGPFNLFHGDTGLLDGLTY
jgi:hypothetical protein